MDTETPKSGIELAKDIASIVGTVITVVGTIAAVVIGYLGLITWRVQLKDTADRDLARRILISLYKVKGLVGHIRRPFREYSIPEDARGDKKAEEDAYSQTYQVEWNKLAEERGELQVAAIEAQAVWEKDFLRHLVPLNQHLVDLEMHLQDYLKSRRNPHEEVFDREKGRKVIWGWGSNDEWGKQLDGIIDDIDKTVRPRFDRT